jgi:hypothetical protein
MIISVTQKHIDDGLRGNCSKDPIALSLLDAGFKKVWVSPDALRLDDKVYEMPGIVAVFIRDFDNTRFVDPFEWELEEE